MSTDGQVLTADGLGGAAFEDFRLGAGYMQFDNSVRKHTKALYVRADKKAFDYKGIDFGYGLFVGKFLTGYNLKQTNNFYGAPLLYVEKGRLGATVTFVPTIGSSVDGSIQYKVHYKVLKF